MSGPGSLQFVLLTVRRRINVEMMAGDIQSGDIHFRHQHGLLGINSRRSGKGGQSAGHQRYCPVIHDACNRAASTRLRPLFFSFFLSFLPAKAPRKWRRENKRDGNTRQSKIRREIVPSLSIRHRWNTIAAVHTSASITAGKQIDADEDNFPKINEPTKSKTAKLGGSEDGKRL